MVKIISTILCVTIATFAVATDVSALRPIAHQNVYSVKSASPGHPGTEAKFARRARTKFNPPFYLSPVFYLLIVVFTFALHMYIMTPLTLVGALVAACLLNGSMLLICEIIKQNSIMDREGDHAAISFDVPKRTISVKALSDAFGMTIFAISLNMVSILLWVFRSQLFGDISAQSTIMAILLAASCLYLFLSTTGWYVPETILSRNEVEKRIADAFKRVSLVAVDTEDKLLMKSLARVRGTSVVPSSEYKKVLQDGKDAANDRILFTANLAVWRGLLKYLVTRRSIGFYYDRILAASADRHNSLFWFLVLRLIWEIRSDWEVLKRSPRLYPTLIPYILLHSLQYNAVALSFLVPMGIIAAFKLLNKRDRLALSYVIDTIINFDAFEDKPAGPDTVAAPIAASGQSRVKTKKGPISRSTRKRELGDPLAAKLKKGKANATAMLNKTTADGSILPATVVGIQPDFRVKLEFASAA